MTKVCYLVACAIAATPLVVAAAFAQMPSGMPQAMGDCPAGTKYVPPGRDGAGNPVPGYCAADPAGRGAYDPYAGQGTPDPQGYRGGGPTQAITPSR